MNHPFSTLEGLDSFDNYHVEGFLDGCAEKPSQLNSDDMLGGGGLDDFLSRYSIYESLQHPQPKDEALPAPFASLNGKRNGQSNEGDQLQLSTEQIVRIASALFVQTSSLVAGGPSNIRLPFGLSLSSLGADELKSVELVGLLLAAAEKVSNEQYSRASALLRQCDASSSKFGNAAQRVVYYFSDALQERIDRETGKLSSKWQMEDGTLTPQDVVKAMLRDHPVQLVAHNSLPFSQVLQFTAMHAHLENVASARRIHMIDLSIRYGEQWAVFLHGLSTRSSCPIESLKISAVGESEETITTAGKRLSSFAESLCLPLTFKPVISPDMEELRETMFELEEGEVVGIYTSLGMNSLIMKPKSLDNLLRVIQKIRPSLLTVTDVEAKHNSRSFINRFTESLFFYSAYFDCLGSLMERNDKGRLMIEGFFSQGIKSTIACEGSERVVRQVVVSVWRAFFKRFGLREADISEWSIYQANLLVKQFVGDGHRGSCTLEMDGKALLIGWKGTPLHFVSAWKFSHEEVVSMAPRRTVRRRISK